MGRLIALDSMNFIYLFESDNRYIKTIEPLFEAIESGQLNGLTSIISVIETLSPHKLESHPHSRSEINRFFNETPHLQVYPVSLDVAEESARLRRIYPTLRTPDAIQLATALVYHADLFLTQDLKISKIKLPPLKIQTITQFTLKA